MSEREHEILRQIRKLTHEMLALADEGQLADQDASRAILYGILRDMAYRLRQLVDREQSRLTPAGEETPAVGAGTNQD